MVIAVMTTQLPDDWADQKQVERWFTDAYGYEPTYRGATNAVMNAVASQTGKLSAENERLEAENDRLTEIHHRITQWCKAYPLEVFPEPDFKRAEEVLQAHGMGISAISASNMRHVLAGIQRIIDGSE